MPRLTRAGNAERSRGDGLLWLFDPGLALLVVVKAAAGAQARSSFLNRLLTNCPAAALLFARRCWRRVRCACWTADPTHDRSSADLDLAA